MPRTLVGREASSHIVIKNDGDVPCMAKLDLPESPHYQVTVSNSDLMINPVDGTLKNDYDISVPLNSG